VKKLELWRWRYYDEACRKHCTSRAMLSEADAAVQYPDGAVKVEGSLEIRMAPETDEEMGGLGLRLQPKG
jgi:hypothetical protein